MFAYIQLVSKYSFFKATHIERLCDNLDFFRSSGKIAKEEEKIRIYIYIVSANM